MQPFQISLGVFTRIDDALWSNRDSTDHVIKNMPTVNTLAYDVYGTVLRNFESLMDVFQYLHRLKRFVHCFGDVVSSLVASQAGTSAVRVAGGLRWTEQKNRHEW